MVGLRLVAGHTIGTAFRGSSIYDDAGGATPLLSPDECLRMPEPKKDAQGLITEAGDMVVSLRIPGNLWAAASLFPG